MSAVSNAGADDGLEQPDEIDVYEVDPTQPGYMAPHQRPTLVIMWHGNGYKRDDCWIQVDVDAACDLNSYL
jgi:hypothetical protein